MSEIFDEQSRTNLVKYRVERADETLMEARLLAKEGSTTMPPSTACIMHASTLHWHCLRKTASLLLHMLG